MSAFFSWDYAPVIRALLAELKRQGRSISPSGYDLGADEWADPIKLDLPNMGHLEYFTDEWDVNMWDDDGYFTVTAYPVYGGKTDCSSWITLLKAPFEKGVSL